MKYLASAREVRGMSTDELRANFLLDDLFQPNNLVLHAIDLDVLCARMCAAQVLGKDAGGEAIARVVRESDRLRLAAERAHGEHGAEKLRFEGRCGNAIAIQYRRRIEEARR